MAQLLSNINFDVKAKLNKVIISWDKYSNDAEYLVIKKKMGKPFGQSDGIQVYEGKDTIVEDVDIKNGVLYYYRLFILYDPLDKFQYISDNRCVARIITLNDKEWTNYGKHLYEQTPRDVRYNDSMLEQPLKRFLDILSFPFNKIETFSNLMIEQIDIESCDEKYLPYHAKWINCLYDERFGSDINRLILKTMNEAEPYIGTKTGLTYILQRIFKAEVEITQEKRGVGYEHNIRLFFDDDNKWLSNMEASDSIMKIIVNYCALRTKFSMVSNLVSSDEYDRGLMSDYFFYDNIMENTPESYVIKEDDILKDFLDCTNENIFEVYTKGTDNSQTDKFIGIFEDEDLHIRFDATKENVYENNIIDAYIKLISDIFLDNIQQSNNTNVDLEKYLKIVNDELFSPKIIETLFDIYNRTKKNDANIIIDKIINDDRLTKIINDALSERNADIYDDIRVLSEQEYGLTNDVESLTTNTFMTNAFMGPEKVVHNLDGYIDIPHNVDIDKYYLNKNDEFIQMIDNVPDADISEKLGKYFDAYLDVIKKPNNISADGYNKQVSDDVNSPKIIETLSDIYNRTNTDLDDAIFKLELAEVVSKNRIDDEETKVIRTRPLGLTNSDALTNISFYTNDI